jgi:pilus assembly protein CpaD
MTTPRTKQALVSLAALVLLAGCQTLRQPATGDWSEVQPRKAPVAQAVTYAHPVRFAPEDGVLPSDQRETLDAFVARVRPGAKDKIEVKAHGGMVDAGRASAVADRLAAHGLAPVVVRADGEQPADVVRVAVHTYIVTLPGCPDWTAHPSHSFSNSTSSNFGCATARNLGLMVAEPADLIAGREIGPADGVVQAGAVKRYHDDEVKTFFGHGARAATAEAETGTRKEK